MPNRIERISDIERQYVAEVLGTQFETSKGSVMCTRLEQAFAKKLGVRFAVSFINGTATMHAALEAAGVGPGDEVIVPSLTMASTAFVALQAMRFRFLPILTPTPSRSNPVVSGSG